jgi:hypothetical protein
VGLNGAPVPEADRKRLVKLLGAWGSKATAERFGMGKATLENIRAKGCVSLLTARRLAELLDLFEIDGGHDDMA